MVKYLLDTCIVISILRGDKEIQAKVEEVGIQNCAISELTMAELYSGPYRVLYGDNDESSRIKATRQLQSLHVLKGIFEVLPWEEAGEEFAKEHERLRSKGKIIEDMDLLQAAYAIAHNMILVTGNTKHFDRISMLKIENWY